MARLVVFGAEGFVGRHLQKALKIGGHEVVSVSRSARPLNQAVDLNDRTEVAKAVRAADAAISLVGLAHSQASIASLWESNVRVNEYIAAICRHENVHRFVYLSSIKAVGEVADSTTPLNTASPPAPTTDYGVTKRASELALQAILDQTTLRILRTPLIYGLPLKGNLATLDTLVKHNAPIPRQILDTPRSLVWVDNVCTALTRLSLSSSGAPALSTVSDGEPVTINEVLDSLAMAANKRVRTLRIPSVIWQAANDHGPITQVLAKVAKPLVVGSDYPELSTQTTKQLSYILKERLSSSLDG